ncbi:hypothetical protein PT318_03060 [Metamycoplasma hyosynoviae]|uniref:hypothetical protein n=1 Tax=Metamycoplasma hyosynoviae TaxID=29559 RepID=UPI0023621490|nr:hypothetical protein [Metamycoplasma hyosynoviae]MDD1375216.1 hypothetical protein [Metamycoplasma hyosynoviae]
MSLKKNVIFTLSISSLPVLPLTLISCSNTKEITSLITKLEGQNLDLFTLNITNSFGNLIDTSNNKSWFEENKPLFASAVSLASGLNNLPKNVSEKEYANLKKNFLNFFYDSKIKDDLTNDQLNEMIKEKGFSDVIRKNSLIVLNTHKEYTEFTKPFWENNATLDKIKANLDKKYTKEYFDTKSVILIANVPKIIADFSEENNAVIGFDIRNVTMHKTSKKVSLNLNIYHYLQTKSSNNGQISNLISNNFTIEIKKTDLNNISKIWVNGNINNIGWFSQYKK